ncbi:MAG TPA: VCBS repeat-containing protein [Pyrinomonadaceae bacterium]|nr:VCBS repeat-containing protein [Pyrinomonadaceae bacterium]
MKLLSSEKLSQIVARAADRPLRIGFLFVAYFALLSAFPHKPHAGHSPLSRLQQAPTLVFVVSRPDPNEPQSVDAVLMIEDGKFKPPYAEESEAAQKKFAEEFFAAGKKYRVTFGGGEVGTATINGSSVGCNNVHATATVDASNQIPSRLSALATNSESIGRKQASRRAPTTVEREEVMKLVHQIYRSRRTTPAMLRTLKTTNLTATDLDGDGTFEMIGSFVIETKTKARRDLLLIAEPKGTGYSGGFINFQSYQLPSEGFASAIDFVDQLDVDGDGVAEVFATQGGFDAYGYNIYKKVNGRWREVLRTIGDAC